MTRSVDDRDSITEFDSNFDGCNFDNNYYSYDLVTYSVSRSKKFNDFVITHSHEIMSECRNQTRCDDSR